MNSRNTIFATALAAGTIVGAAHADVFLGSGGAITDNNATGNRFTLNIGQSLIMSGVSVTVSNFQHNYVGDLTATLFHVPSGKSIVLFDRIGRITTSNSNSGDSSDFNGSYTFADGGSNIWSAAAGLGSSADLASGTYYASGSGIGSTVNTGPSAQSFATIFAGTDAQGEWALEIKDQRNSNSAGSGWSWSMEVATVPVPGAIALLGAAGFIGLGRRRSGQR